MAEIYSQANHVLVWLGQDNLNIQLALRNLPHSGHHTVFEDDLSVQSTKGSDRALVEAAKENHCNPIVTGLRDLCNLKYWGRLWVVQEFRLSAAKTLLYGSEFVSAERFSSFLRLYDHCMQQKYPDILPSASTSAHALCLGQSKPTALQEHPQTLVQTLLHYQHSRCADFHDHIYALRSIFTNGHRITVDYAMGKIDWFFHALIFGCEELFALSATVDLFSRLNDYSQLCDVLIELLNLREDPPTQERVTQYRDVRMRCHLQSFYLDLPQTDRKIELDSTSYALDEPNDTASRRLVEEYVDENFGTGCVGRLECFKFKEHHEPVEVYFISSAALILVTNNRDPRLIYGIIKLEKRRTGRYPFMEFYDWGLKGVRIVSDAATETPTTHTEPRFSLLFDDTRVGILAGVILFGVPTWLSDARTRKECKK